MSDIIPFITGEENAGYAKKLYADSSMVRLPIVKANRLIKLLPKNSKVWLDPSVDGCDDIDSRRSTGTKTNNWFELMKHAPNFEKFNDPSFLAKPVQTVVDEFVNHIMDSCAELRPSWITAPMLPMVNGNERNKVNRCLAKSVGKWKSYSSYIGRLILPLIITNQKQITSKTGRNPNVDLAGKCYHDAQADGFWVVDKSLDDEDGSVNLRNKRFRAVIDLHEELNERIVSKIRIGGPYWGLNLVLWAKGLVDWPAIGLGSGYQYYLSGGTMTSANPRVAIPSLRRRVRVGPALAEWLDKSIAKLAVDHPARNEFVDLKKQLTILGDSARAKEQVAKFYRDWTSTISNVPKAGRSMALFQDLSAAYALGRSLPSITSEGSVRQPSAVAESLMLSCL